MQLLPPEKEEVETRTVSCHEIIPCPQDHLQPHTDVL